MLLTVLIKSKIKLKSDAFAYKIAIFLSIFALTLVLYIAPYANQVARVIFVNFLVLWVSEAILTTEKP